MSSTTSSVLESATGDGVTTSPKDVIETVTPSSEEFSVNATGGSHDHSITIQGGTTGDADSTEEARTQTSFKIEPNHYSLIFIMKL